MQNNITRIFNGSYANLIRESVLNKNNIEVPVNYESIKEQNEKKIYDVFNKSFNPKNSQTETIETSTGNSPATDKQQTNSGYYSSITSTSPQNKNSSFIKQLIEKLKTDSQNNLYAASFIVFLLGLLHTLEAGHSKIVMAALLVNKQMNLRQGLGYAGVFTITHVADILLLGILFVTANAFIDIYNILPYLQIFSLYALLFVAFYLLIKNTAHYIHHKSGRTHKHKHHHSHCSTTGGA